MDEWGTLENERGQWWSAPRWVARTHAAERHNVPVTPNRRFKVFGLATELKILSIRLILYIHYKIYAK